MFVVQRLLTFEVKRKPAVNSLRIGLAACCLTGSLAAQDPRRQKLIAAVLNDFERLGRE